MKQELVGGIVIIVIGLSLRFLPIGILWAFTEKWKTEGGGQPSKSYTILMRTVGTVFSVFGAALIVYGL